MSAKGFMPRPNLPRYWWHFNSDGKVSEDDIHTHLLWMLAQLRKGRLLSELGLAGYQYWFSVFWQSNGTGGGPLITQQTAELLLRHKADLGIGFYLE
jgi:hypothetical protein